MPKTPLSETRYFVAVARLDADGVYHGTDEIPDDQVTDDHVLLPDGCDLPLGKYAWDRDKASFVPLANPQQRAESAPLALNALAWLLLAQWDAGTVLPPPCLEWLDFYIKTIDFGYAITPPLQRYITERGIK